MSIHTNEDRDLEMEALVAPLDPGHADETYWPRFHRTTMGRALNELARRKVVANLTVSDLVSSWARTLLPTAAAAAAVAGFFLLRPIPVEDHAALIAVEEELIEGFEGQTIPDVLEHSEIPDAGGAVFASEIF